jgi:pyruvate/2-oxoglutarate dehydrogenase complex dihydrolipoamide dehydrogenase (E3) component
MFRRFGSEVTVLQRGAQLLDREDPDIASAIKDILTEDGIKIHLNAEVNAVEPTSTGVRVTGVIAGAALLIEGSQLLVAVGRAPNTERLNLAAAGIEVNEHGYIKVNDRLETNVPNVYAIGDIKGGPAFTHISYDDFRVLKRRLIDGDSDASIAGRLIPYAVFIDPQLGRVGLSETDAKRMGKRIRVAKLPMTSVARAAERGETRGFMKAIVDAESPEILGCAILGMEGGEIMAMFEIAMMGSVPYTALKDGIFAHPTLAEALNNLFATLSEP